MILYIMQKYSVDEAPTTLIKKPKIEVIESSKDENTPSNMSENHSDCYICCLLTTKCHFEDLAEHKINEHDVVLSKDHTFNQNNEINLPIQQNEISSMNSDIPEDITSNDGTKASVKDLKGKEKKLKPNRKASRGPKYISTRQDYYLKSICNTYNLQDVDIVYTEKDYKKIRNYAQFCKKYEGVIQSANIKSDVSSTIKQHLMPAKWRQFIVSRSYTAVHDARNKNSNKTIPAVGTDIHGVELVNERSNRLTEIEKEENKIVKEIENMDQKRRILIDRLAELRQLRKEKVGSHTPKSTFGQKFNDKFRCDICNLKTPDKSSIEQHFLGKKHKKAIRAELALSARFVLNKLITDMHL